MFRHTTAVQPLRLAIAIEVGAMVTTLISLLGIAVGASLAIASPAMQITALIIAIGTIAPSHWPAPSRGQGPDGSQL